MSYPAYPSLPAYSAYLPALPTLDSVHNMLRQRSSSRFGVLFFWAKKKGMPSVNGPDTQDTREEEEHAHGEPEEEEEPRALYFPHKTVPQGL